MLKARMKSLEQAILGQSNDYTHNNSTFSDSVANDKLLLKNLLEEQRKTAFLRTRFKQLNDMDAPTSFFALEKKPRELKSFHQLKVPGGGVITDQREIQSYALSFYEDLYSSESRDDTATDELLCDLSKLTEEERNELDRPFDFWRDFTSCSGNVFWEVTYSETHIEQQTHSRSCVLRADTLVSPGLEEL